MALTGPIHTETGLVGQIVNNSLSTTGLTVAVRFTDRKTGAARTPQSDTLFFTFDKDNSSFEIIKSDSHSTVSGLTTIVINAAGRAMPKFGIGAGGATGIKHAIGAEVGCVDIHWPYEAINTWMDGTEGSGSTDLRIGDETDSDIFYYAENADGNKPYLKYIAASSKWVFSDDGVIEEDMGAAGSVGTLQQVFDNGQTIVVADTENLTLSLTQNDVTNDPNAFELTNITDGDSILMTQNGTGNGLFIQQTGVLGGGSNTVAINASGGVQTQPLISITQGNGASTGTLAEVSNSGTGAGILFAQDGVLDASKNALLVYTNAQQVNAPLVYFLGGTGATSEPTLLVETQASVTGSAIEIENNGAGHGLHINQDLGTGASKYALFVESSVAQNSSPLARFETTGSENAIEVSRTSTGGGIDVTVASTSAGLHGLAVRSASAFTASALVKFYTTNASATASTLEIQHDAVNNTDPAVYINSASGGLRVDTADGFSAIVNLYQHTQVLSGAGSTDKRVVGLTGSWSGGATYTGDLSYLAINTTNSSNADLSVIELFGTNAGSGTTNFLDIQTAAGIFHDNSAVPGTQDKRLKVEVGGTQYYVALYR